MEADCAVSCCSRLVLKIGRMKPIVQDVYGTRAIKLLANGLTKSRRQVHIRLTIRMFSPWRKSAVLAYYIRMTGTCRETSITTL